jgi:hypothetical protein
LTDFDRILSVVLSESFQNIEEHWNSMLLEKCRDYELPLERDINGLYALKHPRYGIIYIGKGKPILRRVRSHYKATQGVEHAPAWREFFKLINTDITVYWYSIDHPEPFIAEQYREALERLLQIKYKPLFDIIFSQLGYREVEDFDRKIQEYIAKLLP